jgi:hypothetical protein
LTTDLDGLFERFFTVDEAWCRVKGSKRVKRQGFTTVWKFPLLTGAGKVTTTVLIDFIPREAKKFAIGARMKRTN